MVIKSIEALFLSMLFLISGCDDSVIKKSPLLEKEKDQFTYSNPTPDDRSSDTKTKPAIENGAPNITPNKDPIPDRIFPEKEVQGIPFERLKIFKAPIDDLVRTRGNSSLFSEIKRLKNEEIKQMINKPVEIMTSLPLLPEGLLPPLLKTDDGMYLEYDDNDGFKSISFNKFKTNLKKTIGVAIKDYNGNQKLTPENKAVASKGSNYIKITRSENSFTVKEEWLANNNHIELKATIETPGKSAFDACINLPIDLNNKYWYHDQDYKEKIVESKTYSNLLGYFYDIQNIDYADRSQQNYAQDINTLGISYIGDDQSGLAIAIDPDAPAVFDIKYDNNAKNFVICFHLGTIDKRPHVDIKLAIFSPDNPKWGIRSAIQKWYEIYPDAFKHGMNKEMHGLAIESGFDRDVIDGEKYHIEALWTGFDLNYNKNLGDKKYQVFYLCPNCFDDQATVTNAISLNKTYPVKHSHDDWSKIVDTHTKACTEIYSDFKDHIQDGPEIKKKRKFESWIQLSPKKPQPIKYYGPVYDGSRNAYNIYPTLIKLGDMRVDKKIYETFYVSKALNYSMMKRDNLETIFQGANALVSVGENNNTNKSCFFLGLNPDPGRSFDLRTINCNQNKYTPKNWGEYNIIALYLANRCGDKHLESTAHKNIYYNYNGAGLDVVGVYARLDFSEKSVDDAVYPLTYSRKTGGVAEQEFLGTLALMKEIRKVLENSRAFVINGFPVSTLLGSGVDYFMAEDSPKEVNLWEMRNIMLKELDGEARMKKYLPGLYEKIELLEDKKDKNIKVVTTFAGGPYIELKLRQFNKQRLAANKRPITIISGPSPYGVLKTLDISDPSNNTFKTIKNYTSHDALLHTQKILPALISKGIYLVPTAIQLVENGAKGIQHRILGKIEDSNLIAIRELTLKYIDIVYDLNSAKWEPVPYAEIQSNSKSEIIVERFGKEWITVFNRGENKVDFTVDIYWKDMGLVRAPDKVLEKISSKDVFLKESIQGISTTEQMTIEPNNVMVFKIGG